MVQIRGAENCRRHGMRLRCFSFSLETTRVIQLYRETVHAQVPRTQ